MTDTPRIAKDAADDWTVTLDAGLYAAALLETDPIVSWTTDSIAPSGLTVGTPAVADAFSGLVRMAGGTKGTSYLVRGTWTTQSGQVGGWKVWVDVEVD